MGVPSTLSVVRFKKTVADSILSYSMYAYPKEGILLLRGKTGKGEVLITEVLTPPSATQGRGFSGFSSFMLPMDRCHWHFAFSSLGGSEAFNSRPEPLLWEDHSDRSLSV